MRRGSEERRDEERRDEERRDEERRDEERRCGLGHWDARFGPHPRPLSHTQERGDSGGRLGHLIAVHSHDEHLFGPPLNPKWERGDSGGRVWPPMAVYGYYEQLFCPPLNVLGEGRGWSLRG
jgi:hypothetical protein